MANSILPRSLDQAGSKYSMDTPRVGHGQKRRTRLLLQAACGLLLVAALLVVGFLLKPASSSVARDSVLIDTVRQGSFVRAVSGIGTLVPQESHWITSRNEAQVEKILLWPGSSVAPGSIIVLMSSPELQQAVADADAEVTSSQARVVNLQMQLRGQALERKAALTKAEGERDAAVADLEVNQRLAKNGLISTLDMKKSEIMRRELQGLYEIEKQRCEFADHAIAPQLAIASDEADHAKARARLRHEQWDALRVRAGMTGILQQIMVQAGQRLAAGSSVARVADPTKLKAEIKIPETQARDLVIGQPATIDTRSSGVIPGIVSRIAPSVEQGAVLVDIDFGSHRLPRGIRPDLAVEGTVQLEKLEHVIYMGRPSFGPDNGQLFLFKIVANGEAAHRIPVLLGRSSVNAVEIRQGLVPGDKVILSDMSAHDNQNEIRLR